MINWNTRIDETTNILETSDVDELLYFHSVIRKQLLRVSKKIYKKK